MDKLVIQAMAKWPNVPDCYGWLGLDARGDWYMRDDAAQAAGPFWGPGATAQSKGSRLAHDGLVAFIGRNYAQDRRGCWYFQNGPQRVFVDLAHTPWIARLGEDGPITTHTGLEISPTSAWLDESGRCYFSFEQGVALIHTQDVEVFSRRLEAGEWPLENLISNDLPEQFAFVKTPQKSTPPAGL
jgi:hypothetical protein